MFPYPVKYVTERIVELIVVQVEHEVRYRLAPTVVTERIVELIVVQE